ncbi:MAG: HAMP domain-containing histidine kinase [Flammeovirgaceae bacterium]|nr:MAG: HAMP domain-containing histidine kinase [Flammeovirgaceae bacterium]
MRSRFENWLLGPQPIPSHLEYKTALLRATLAIISITVGAVYIIADAFYRITGNSPFYIFAMIAGTITLLLNRRRYFTLASIVFMIAINGVVFLFADSDPFYTGIYAYFICTSLTAFALFGIQKKFLALGFSALALILCLTAYWTEGHLLNHNVVPPAYANIYLTINITVALVTSVAIIYFLTTLNQHSERILQNQNNQLAKANAELDQFAYSVSHDLRAPLSSILGLINLYNLAKSESEKDSLVALISGRVNTLDQFIRDILDNSRNSRMEIKLEEVKLSDMIRQVVSQLSHMRDFGKQELQLHVPETFSIITDAGRLRMILSNLISNAVKYYDPAKPNPYIRISAGIENPHWYLTVEDNGLGISDNHRGKLFDMFYRAHAHGEGSGLGLYIVNEVCKKMGGSISVKTVYGEGSSFTVRLPLINL